MAEVTGIRNGASTFSDRLIQGSNSEVPCYSPGHCEVERILDPTLNKT